MNIVLDQEDFRKLISGEIVHKGSTKIVLSDIGYDVMIKEINRKIHEEGK